MSETVVSPGDATFKGYEEGGSRDLSSPGASYTIEDVTGTYPGGSLPSRSGDYFMHTSRGNRESSFSEKATTTRSTMSEQRGSSSPYITPLPPSPTNDSVVDSLFLSGRSSGHVDQHHHHHRASHLHYHEGESSSTTSLLNSSGRSSTNDMDKISNDRQMLIVYLLSQVCSMRDPTPNLFSKRPSSLTWHTPFSYQ